MEEKHIKLADGQNLEQWLKVQESPLFPPYSVDRGEKPYPERYEEVKKAFLPVHNSVVQGAMAAGAIKWMEESSAIISKLDSKERKKAFYKLTQSDPIVHLNNHGLGHVDKVVDRVSEMLHFFDRNHLTPYEGFLLLCAIQAHDIGNVFGRENHERRCKEILEDKAKLFIPDKIERKVIEKLALVHGGAIEDDRDTIGFLTESKQLNDRTVRKKLLAALLRFGDELADDSTRADRDGLEKDTIIEGSRIYHQYSQALHTVKIERATETERIQLKLSYEFDSDLATQQLIKNGKKKYLLDEIYDRTLKMERERRYCMRFLRPCFSLDAIRVEIVIQHAKNPFKRDRIEYTLEENGYPAYPSSGRLKDFLSEVRSGEEERRHLIKDWGVK